jgi:hypothetical protein
LILESEAGPFGGVLVESPEGRVRGKFEIRSRKQYRNSNDRNTGTAVLNIGDSIVAFLLAGVKR